MPSWTISLLLFLPIALVPTHGRLKDIMTERLPVLDQNLHKTSIDLKAISRRASPGPRSEFRLKNGDFHQTAKGSQRVRLVQTYAGYEVYGPTAVAELNTRGHFTGHLYGEVARNLHKDIPNPEACVRDIKVLLNIAIRLEKLNPGDPTIDKTDGRRVIYADPHKRKARIVYVVEFFYNKDSQVLLPVYYFDACSWSVLFSYNDVRSFSVLQNTTENLTVAQFSDDRNNASVKFKSEILKRLSKVGVGCETSAKGDGGNKKIGHIYYNSPPFCLSVRKRRNKCTMEGNYFRVVDNKKSRNTGIDITATFKCKTGYRDKANGAYGVANDALFYGEVTGSFFHSFFGQRGLPYKPRIVVHFGKDFENAFWSGGDMYFGDGKDLFYPLVSLDIVAHEFGHGITRRHSNLVYREQSGGINEAYSDISAVATASYATGKYIWNLGEDVMKARRTALRYVDNPPLDGNSIKNIFAYTPRMDVHYSSGVFNYAFYKMVTSFRFSMQDAYASFFIANKLLWGRFTRFRRGACNVMQSSYDAGTNHRAVRRAFSATGIRLILCSKKGIKTTLFPGEARENILVSSSRSPIFEIDMNHWSGFGVEAVTDARPGIIRVLVATDDDADQVIARGDNYVQFPANQTRLHVKLMSDHKTDIKVTLKVLH